MIKVADLAKELRVKEDELFSRAVGLQIKLKARGKSLQDADAERLRESYASKEDESGEKTKKKVALPPLLSIKDFAARMEVSSAEVLKILIQNGVLANLNADIDFDTASIIGDELGFEVIPEGVAADEELEEIIGTDNKLQEILALEDPKNLKDRPPIITIMGHVDHGKTSLLDTIRKTEVTAGEQGGITQHIGAYQIHKNDRLITFLDTPGHEAFTAMRARGSQVTDVAVLVVAGDDGVRPQTIEALDHAKAAEVPIVVAVNKMDKPGADLEKVKRELTEHNLVPEDWGGTTIFVPVSAKTGEGIEELLEMILLAADVREVKANPDRPAIGTVVEAKKTTNKGVSVTVLVQSGTLRQGDPILVGSTAGRVKAMHSDTGEKVKEALPSMPVEIIGLSNVPAAGDVLQVVQDDKTANQLSNLLMRKERAEKLRPKSMMSLESFYENTKHADTKTLNLILKADVDGSLEAIKGALQKIETSEVKIDFVHTGTGEVVPADITLASASGAVVIAFNVRKSTTTIDMIRTMGVDVRSYKVIYKLIEDVKNAMSGLLSPEDVVVIEGQLQVRAVFSSTRDRWTVGGYISEGKFARNAKVRVMRDDMEVGAGKIVSLRRETTDVKEVKSGVDCGMLVKGVKGGIAEGDRVEIIRIEKRSRSL